MRGLRQDGEKQLRMLPKASMPRVRETGAGGLMDRIQKALGRVPRCVFWRNQAGAYRHGGRFITYGLTKGAADLIGIVQLNEGGLGRFVAIEVKAPDGKQTEEQEAFERLVELAGGAYVLARSVDDAVIAVLRIQKGERR